MSCFITSEAGAKSSLRSKQLIDDYLNIPNGMLGRFREEVTRLSRYANDKYGVSERLFFDEQNGTKAVPNQRAFQIIDWKKGIKYPENEWVGNSIEQVLDRNFITMDYYQSIKNRIELFEKEKNLNNFINVPFYIPNAPDNIKRKMGLLLDKDQVMPWADTDISKSQGFILVYEDEQFNLYTSSQFEMLQAWGIGTVNLKKIDISGDEMRELIKYADVGMDTQVRWDQLQNILSNQMYQLQSYSRNQLTPEVKEQLHAFLKKVNPDFRVEVLDNLSVNGLTQIPDFLIKLKTGKEDALAEETAHVFVELLGDKKLKSELMNDVVRTRMYQQVIKDYGTLYGMDYEKLKRETAAKLISLYIQDRESFNYWSGSEQLNKNLGNLITRLINWIKRNFLNPYSESARRILRGSVDGIDLSLAKEGQTYYQIDERYKWFETLNENDITKYQKIYINLNNTLLDYTNWKSNQVGNKNPKLVKSTMFSDLGLRGELDRFYRDAQLTKLGRELKDKLEMVNANRIIIFTDAPITNDLITRVQDEFGDVSLIRTGYNIQQTLFDEFGNPVDQIISGSEKEAFMMEQVKNFPSSNLLFVDNRSVQLSESQPNLTLKLYDNQSAVYTDIPTRQRQELLASRNKEFNETVVEELGKVDKENLVQLARQSMNMVKNHVRKLSNESLEELSSIFRDKNGNLLVPFTDKSNLLTRLLENVDTFEQGLVNFVQTIESTRMFFHNANENDYKALKDLIQKGDTESVDKAIRETALIMRMILSWEQWVKEMRPYINDTKIINRVINDLSGELQRANIKLNDIAVDVLSKSLSEQWKPFNEGKLQLYKQDKITKEQYEEQIYSPQKIVNWLIGNEGDMITGSAWFENPLMQSEPLLQAISKRIEMSIIGGEYDNLKRINQFQIDLWNLQEKIGLSDEEIGKKITFVDQENYWEDGEMKQRPTLYILNEHQGTWMRKSKEVEVRKLKDKWLELKNSGQNAENEELIYRKAQEELDQWIKNNWYDEVTPDGKDIYLKFGLEDEIMKLAKEKQKEIYDQLRQYTNDLQRIYITEQMEENLNKEIERLVRELRLLRNEYTPEGERKQGIELLIAQKLKDKSIVDRQIYDYEFQTQDFINAINEQILSIADENTQKILLGLISTDNLSELYNVAKQIAPQTFIDWLDRNTRLRFSDDFYEERNELINQLKQLNVQGSEELDELWKEILNTTSFLRDKDSILDGSDSTPEIQSKVKQYELILENLKQSSESNPEIIPIVQRLSEIQSKRYTDYYRDVMFDWLKDIYPISSGQNYLSLINDINFRRWLVSEAPQEFRDWFTRNHFKKQVWDEYTESKTEQIVPTYIWMKTQPTNPKDILVIPGWKYNKRILKDSATITFNDQTVDVQLKTPKIDWVTWNPLLNTWLPKSEQFKNKEYQRLKNSSDPQDKLIFEYLTKVKDKMIEIQTEGNYDSRIGFVAPRLNSKYTEGSIETAFKRGWKAASDRLNPKEEGTAGEETKDKSFIKKLLSFSGIESPEQTEQVKRTDYLGNEFKTVYTPYTAYLSPEETTKNLVMSISSYSMGVEKVKALIKDLPQLNLLQQVFDQFLPKKKGTKNQYGEMINASTNNRKAVLNNIIETKLYSNFKDMELGSGVDKFAVSMRKAAVIGSQSDLNIPNAIKNWLQGQLMNLIFSGDRNWATRRSWWKAVTDHRTSYANYIYEMGKKNKSIDYHILTFFNPLLEHRTKGLAQGERSFELQDRAGMFSSTSAEFSVGSTLLYSHLFNQDVMIDGKKAKLYDAFIIQNGVLSIKPNTYIGEKLITPEYIQEMKLKFKLMLEEIQGKQWNNTLAQRYTVWQSMEFFKKFFIGMFRKRFFTKRDNIELGETEGIYITTARWMIRQIHDWIHGTQFAQALSDQERQNIKAARDEFLLALSSLFIISYLFGFDDDDKDKYKKLKDKGWLENMALLIAINTKRETDALTPFPFVSIQNSVYPPILNETYNFITSPFVGFQVIQEGRKMLDSLLLLSTGDDKALYDRDMPAYLIEKGDSKFEHYMWKVIQLDNFMYMSHPKEKIQVIIQSQNR